MLHNDLKANNVIVCDSMCASQVPSSSGVIRLQIVLIDFGKATIIDQGRRYNLNSLEKSEHTCRYPHIAPEVILLRLQ